MKEESESILQTNLESTGEKEKSVKKRKYEKRKGVDMHNFLGRTWQELEDIWPKNIRLASEAYKIISVISPALQITRRQHEELTGKKLRVDDLFLLFWIHRCEEARENTATAPIVIGKPMQWNKKLYAIKQSRLYQFGLIEHFGRYVDLVRVTGEGKVLMKRFIENLEQAHRDLKYFVSSQPPEGAEKVNNYLQKYCFNWEASIESEKKENPSS